ncbi:MAG TPA: (4Fe-4S)-binding protein [Gemmatimonadales bacterium]|nr:(4Fe-4S)-binding protein [Gemmatimonadales bacterium]
MTRYYAAQEIEITWDPLRCIHAAECVRGLPEVFDHTRRPWIRPAGALPNEIAAVIERCPSGALHYQRLDGGMPEEPDDPMTITAVRNGPLYVRGLVQLRGVDGSVLTDESRMALCRCGASANKPFCDNSHRRVGFADDAAGAS